MLSSDDRGALFAAVEKAREDPAVKAAAARVRQAAKVFNEAMIARDASIGPVLEKAETAGGPESFHIRLSGDESEELRADREAMKGTAAEDALQRAVADYRKALAHAIVLSDPSAAVFVDRLPQMRMREVLMAEPDASPSASPAE
jgi:hypothetical protein